MARAGDGASLVRADGRTLPVADVVSITIEPVPRLYQVDVERYDVVAHLVDRSSRILASGLLGPAAQALGAAAEAALRRT